ncbi:hypothetical protein EW145_g4125 [Phellinidium pouzarii]|uniref:Uncharacterized protein n=1 Tax=Phellinidium pouzarii TaxID=167371 RepID=A0A4S4L4V5_9AGAM|nr:hypothetical protein EW145_g4125 [Phellinidium pouzarii]
MAQFLETRNWPFRGNTSDIYDNEKSLDIFATHQAVPPKFRRKPYFQPNQDQIATLGKEKVEALPDTSPEKENKATMSEGSAKPPAPAPEKRKRGRPPKTSSALITNQGFEGTLAPEKRRRGRPRKRSRTPLDTATAEGHEAHPGLIPAPERREAGNPRKSIRLKLKAITTQGPERHPSPAPKSTSEGDLKNPQLTSEHRPQPQ